MTIESAFDVEFIAGLALREKQIQQNYRPIIAVHKWFARRPGTLFRGLLISEFGAGPLSDSFYKSNDFKGRTIADPFMGGGTPLLEANRLGCDVVGLDINPMSYWIVKQEIEHLDLAAYRQESVQLGIELEKEIGSLYRTTCVSCGSTRASAKYFLWVANQDCEHCGAAVDLFPGYLLAENVRHPKNVLVCPACGELCEVADRNKPGRCISCSSHLSLAGPASRNRCECRECGGIGKYPRSSSGPPRLRMFAIEYHCLKCRPTHEGRFFKRPDRADLRRYAEAEARLAALRPEYVPKDEIPIGDETNRLHKWGYKRYRDTFNARQLLGLEISCQLLSKRQDDRIRAALATNLSDLLRYQNMLCRYDTMALKSLDIFSVHGFPTGLVRCESNLLGIRGGSGQSIGSGGWKNITEKYSKAKEYCDFPFEVLHTGKQKRQIATSGEWIGDRRNGDAPSRQIDIRCESATTVVLKDHSLDGVFTDPPYFGSVQYAELMDYCYVWLRKLVSIPAGELKKASTRHPNELTGNDSMSRGLVHFSEGLSEVFQRMAKALKPGAPLAFTYHHNQLEAYFPIAIAILDSGLACSASFPCPAEMGASIHIRGTGSSVVDTVFVCRARDRSPRRLSASDPESIAGLLAEDIAKLSRAGLRVSSGDIRCIAYGHLTRLAIWKLRKNWDFGGPTERKFDRIGKAISEMGGLEQVLKYLAPRSVRPRSAQADFFREPVSPYAPVIDALAL